MEDLKLGDLNAMLLQKEADLNRVKERLTNPMASDETIRALHKTQNELIADIQDLKIRIDAIQTPRVVHYKDTPQFN
jgi:hypothetical protein